MKSLIPLSCLCSMSLALSQEREGEALLFSRGGDNFVEEFTIPRADIEALSRWSPYKSAVPTVSVTQALDTAIPLLRARAKGWPWRIAAISLYEGRNEEVKGLWYYLCYASVNISKTPDRLAPVSFSIVILMDGTAMCPEVDIPDREGEPAIADHTTPHPSYFSANEIRMFLQGSKVEDHYYIDRDQADTLPKWHPESGQPIPFEAKDAFAMLHQRIKDHLLGHEWRILQFSIMHGAHPESRHIWRYHVNILHKPTGSKSQEKIWNHCFLLDGSMISPDPAVFND